MTSRTDGTPPPKDPFDDSSKISVRDKAKQFGKVVSKGPVETTGTAAQVGPASLNKSQTPLTRRDSKAKIQTPTPTSSKVDSATRTSLSPKDKTIQALEKLGFKVKVGNKPMGDIFAASIRIKDRPEPIYVDIHKDDGTIIQNGSVISPEKILESLSDKPKTPPPRTAPVTTAPKVKEVAPIDPKMTTEVLNTLNKRCQKVSSSTFIYSPGFLRNKPPEEISVTQTKRGIELRKVTQSGKNSGYVETLIINPKEKTYRATTKDPNSPDILKTQNIPIGNETTEHIVRNWLSWTAKHHIDK